MKNAFNVAVINRTITPVLKPFGVTDENWPVTVGVFTGIFAKEVVVGTLNALYGSMDAAAEGGEEEEFSFWGAIGESFATIPANLSDLAGAFLDPLGLSAGDVGDPTVAAEEQEVGVGTFGAMVILFGSTVAAFAYLLFILLYFPCVAATAAVYRETNFKWTMFAGFWTTFMAYLAAVIFYQAATFGSHPASSVAWIAGILIAFAAVVAMMKIIGRREQAAVALAAGARA